MVSQETLTAHAAAIKEKGWWIEGINEGMKESDRPAALREFEKKREADLAMLEKLRGAGATADTLRYVETAIRRRAAFTPPPNCDR